MSQRIALVMAGGGGSRLWPASVADRPKHLLDPAHAGRGRGSLLAATLERLGDVVPVADCFVVTTADQAAAVRAAVPQLAPDHVIVEPSGRNTAACIALGLRHLRAKLGAEVDRSTLIALPADHHVAAPEAFRELLRAACVRAEHEDCIVTLGIEPDRAETAFGYIERAPQALAAVEGDANVAAFAAVRFVEKPALDQAQKFLESGRFLWNAGIFVMPFRRIEAELAQHCPRLWDALELVTGALAIDDPATVMAATSRAYEKVEGMPIDIAVMEKLSDLRVIPANVGWSDLGSWLAVHKLLGKDERGNAVAVSRSQDAVLLGCRDTLVWSDDATVAVIGMEGVAVVASHGKVLVCPLDRAQEVRAVVAELEKRRAIAPETSGS